MNIGLFTDTYFPQVSGVATSIKTLKEALESQGTKFIFLHLLTPRYLKINLNRIFIVFQASHILDLKIVD